MRDLRQTPEYARYMQLLGWSVVRFQMSVFGCQIFVKKIPLLGNIGKLQRPEGKLDLRKLDDFAREHKLAALYVEPSLDTQYLPAQAGSILNTRYTIHKNCFLPSKTIQINLTQPERQLFRELKKDTRYSLRRAKEAGVKVVESEDIPAFIKMWQAAARRRGMWLPQKKEIFSLWKAFGQKAHILFALTHKHNPSFRYIDISKENGLVSGVLIVESPDIAYYMYAFSTEEGNRLSAPTFLVWEAIRLAKRNGCKIFDFEGIYDERYPQTKNWKGFTKFKEGFGGKIVTYPQTLVGYYSPLVKLLNL